MAPTFEDLYARKKWVVKNLCIDSNFKSWIQVAGIMLIFFNEALKHQGQEDSLQCEQVDATLENTTIKNEKISAMKHSDAAFRLDLDKFIRLEMQNRFDNYESDLIWKHNLFFSKYRGGPDSDREPGYNPQINTMCITNHPWKCDKCFGSGVANGIKIYKHQDLNTDSAKSWDDYYVGTISVIQPSSYKIDPKLPMTVWQRFMYILQQHGQRKSPYRLNPYIIMDAPADKDEWSSELKEVMKLMFASHSKWESLLKAENIFEHCEMAHKCVKVRSENCRSGNIAFPYYSQGVADGSDNRTVSLLLKLVQGCKISREAAEEELSDFPLLLNQFNSQLDSADPPVKKAKRKRRGINSGSS